MATVGLPPTNPYAQLGAPNVPLPDANDLAGGSGLTPAMAMAVQRVSGDLVAAPTTPPLAALGAAGALTGTYGYSVTFVTALGETAPWPGTPITVTPAAQAVNLTNIPIGGDGTIARRLYRTLAAAVDPKDMYFLVEIPNNTTTTYVDNIPDGSLGGSANWAAENQGRLYMGSTAVGSFSDQSTSLGAGTFASKTGYASSAFGFEALKNNVSGRRNTAIGVYALTSLTTGYENTAVGVHAGQDLTTGFRLTAMGYGAARSVTTAEEIVAIGANALGSFTSIPARRCTSIGYNSCLSHAGSYTGVTALGYAAGKYMDANYQVSIDAGIDRATTAGTKDVALLFAQGVPASPQTQFMYLNGAIRLGWATPTVAQLPAASAGLRGCRAYVTDGSVAYTGANIGTTVAGGGANTVPVFCNGTNWVVG